MMDFDPERADEGMFIVAAFRHAIGRRTAAVDCVAAVLCRLAPVMREHDRERICKEIAEAIKVNRAGYSFEVDVWQHVSEVLKKSLEEQSND